AEFCRVPFKILTLAADRPSCYSNGTCRPQPQARQEAGHESRGEHVPRKEARTLPADPDKKPLFRKESKWS
ncbi:MAG: hypothetical protein ACTHK7_03765, partial [Aureliella sp.]